MSPPHLGVVPAQLPSNYRRPQMQAVFSIIEPQPPLFADRDAVVQINVTLDQSKESNNSIQASRTVNHTVSDEYVRMRIEGYYDLEEISPTKTRVKYYVTRSRWMDTEMAVRLASEESPLRTIQGLRRRV